MRRVSLERIVGSATAVAATAAIALLIFAPSVEADKGATAKYGYEVVGWSHEANAQLAGSYKFPNPCVPQQSSNWAASVSGGPSELALVKGEGSIRIGHSGTRGEVKATQRMTYDLRDSAYGVVTQCGPAGPVTIATKTCTDSKESLQEVTLKISGGVGDRLKLDWTFGPKDSKLRPYWAPPGFRCGAREFIFGDGDCKTKSSLDKFTAKTLRLPYICASQGTHGDEFRGVQVNGAIELKRTKQG